MLPALPRQFSKILCLNIPLSSRISCLCFIALFHFRKRYILRETTLRLGDVLSKKFHHITLPSLPLSRQPGAVLENKA